MTSAVVDEHLLRDLAPQVLAAVTRRYGHFDTAEDAVQEALLAAATQWPDAGVPDDPRAWLITVASRRLVDLLRSEQSRHQREDTVLTRTLPGDYVAPPADLAASEQDDTLILLFMCCHPALSAPSQIALTLRAVGGLTTAEIARAFLVPEATMAQRISRAKQRIKTSDLPFELPPPDEQAARLAAVLHVLYLMFNEGYASSDGENLQRIELSNEAIRLIRIVHRLVPEHGEISGLLALMLLTDARRAARVGSDGDLVPLPEQDRRLWNQDYIKEGVELVTAAFSRPPVGPYQLQAAIAAVHDEAATADETDWPQIVALYRLLLRITDNPLVRLNQTVAIAMVRGPAAGLALLDELERDSRLTDNHRLHAVRGHLHELAGEAAAAQDAYRLAAQLTTSLPEHRHLLARAARLTAF